MAGRGPAPKINRQHNKAPKRGEWIELPELKGSVLPDLPEGEWSGRTLHAWEAWRQDRATTQYGPAEIQSAIDLAFVYDEWTGKGGSNMAAEIRQRLDGLGLSPKGKQDRRWRVAAPEEAEVIDTPAKRKRKLRAV